jgi:LPXTG-motif cell wall-anchored protein
MTTSGDVIAAIPAGAAQSGSAIDSLASTSIDNTVTWTQPDPPSVTVNQGAGQIDPTSSSPIVFDVVFSEPVIGFDSSDVDLSASTIGGTLTATVTGSGDTYTVAVDVPVQSALSGWRRVEAPSAGDVVVTLPAGIATGTATGLPSLASTSTDNTVTWTGGSASTTTTSPAGPTTTSPAGPTTTTVPAGSTTTTAGPTTSVAGGSATTTPAALPATGSAGGSVATALALAAVACGGVLVAVTRRRQA